VCAAGAMIGDMSFSTVERWYGPRAESGRVDCPRVCCDPHRHLRRGLRGDCFYPGVNIRPLETAPNGQYRVWLPRAVVDRLARMRGARESYSDVILRMASRGQAL
jgi:hypothetical protein